MSRDVGIILITNMTDLNKLTESEYIYLMQRLISAVDDRKLSSDELRFKDFVVSELNNNKKKGM